MQNIVTRLRGAREQIAKAERRCDRAPGEVTLLAISKSQPITALQAAIDAGQFLFGENYVQEALPKIEALHHPKLQWHFVGDIQRNKAKLIAQHFHWVHSITRASVAEALNKHRSPEQGPLNVCIQINISDESSKAGIALAELPVLAHAIAALPHLTLRGLMAIPAPNFDEKTQREIFHHIAQALAQLQKLGLACDTLSMGMSHDFEAAIAEGATIVRIGQAIFGPRSG